MLEAFTHGEQVFRPWKDDIPQVVWKLIWNNSTIGKSKSPIHNNKYLAVSKYSIESI